MLKIYCCMVGVKKKKYFIGCMKTEDVALNKKGMAEGYLGVDIQ
jgi:hypothetical protein